MSTHPLTLAERHIIEDKGTEPPHSGKYDQFFEHGVYACRRCGAYLYRSDDKFDARCGWPSFDDEITGAVMRSVDADGRRTEITCRRCQGHLGHVFDGEQLTEKNTRHCVNSISMQFVASEEVSHREQIVLGGGCFWCLEASFLLVDGVTEVISGYAGGGSDPLGRPVTYQHVSIGTTGHAEVVQLTFDPTLVSLEKLLDVFFLIHDPTTQDRQGADVGSQYRSIILYQGDDQRDAVNAYLERLRASGKFADPIVTQVQPLEKLYPAEKEHQRYFEKHPDAAYCQVVIRPKVERVRKQVVSRILT